MNQTTSSVDWTSVINSAINQVPSWIAISRGQPVPTAIPQGTQGGSFAISPAGAAFSLSPGLILVGALGLVAIIYLVKK